MFKKMAEFGPDSGGRVKGVTIVKPIVYGNVARYFGKKREEDGHTHQWTVYVKPYRNEDMSAYVKKIQFKLHESYGNPLRVVTKPPYEITETGWGEFEIIIKIFFIDPNERPVTLYHLLKLFQSDSSAMPKKTVVSEFYDEMIFQDPTAMMQQLLTTSRQLTLGAYKHETEFAELEMRTREKLELAKKKSSFEITELKERLKASRENINYLKSEIRKLEEEDQTSSNAATRMQSWAGSQSALERGPVLVGADPLCSRAVYNTAGRPDTDSTESPAPPQAVYKDLSGLYTTLHGQRSIRETSKRLPYVSDSSKYPLGYHAGLLTDLRPGPALKCGIDSETGLLAEALC
ncbi:UNVERIFIED_CONTAM: hypothetical protein FKN15_026486 [Acipenser sinensis]